MSLAGGGTETLCCWLSVAGGGACACWLLFAGSAEGEAAAFGGFETCCWLGLDFDGKSPITN